MRTALIAIGFVAAGLIGAVAARELFPPELPPPTGPRSDLAALEARINDLSAQVDRLSEEVRSRESVVIRPDVPPAAVPDTAEALPAEPPPANGEAPAALTDDRIEKKVVETVEKIARARAEEKARREEAATRKKELEWLRQKQRELDLTDDQVQQFAKLLVQRRATLAVMKRRYDAAPPEQKPLIQAEMKDYGELLRGELRKLLNADQYEAIMHPNRK
jgi:hypothetical protein